MKLPLRMGLPLLGLLLLGLAFTEGRDQLMLLVVAIGVALWSAFSLPHPGPRGEPGPPDGADPANGGWAGDADEADEDRWDEHEEERPGPNGGGTPGPNGGEPPRGR